MNSQTTCRSDKEIKHTQHVLGEMHVLMGQDYEPHVRVGALQTYITELAKLSRDGLILEQDKSLIHGLHGILMSIEQSVALARDLASTFKPLHRETP